MKILYDYQMLINQKYGGISRYFYEIASRMKNIEGVDSEVSAVFSQNHYFEEYFGKKAMNYLPKTTRFIIKLNEMRSKKKIQKGGYDILHPTYYSNYYLSAKPIQTGKMKLVLTVYDMIHELFPQYFSPKDKTAQNKKMLIEKADHIISISESTKNDILKIYPETNAGKITVIHLSSSLKMSAEVDPKMPARYVLFVGSRNGYKNYAVLVKAFALVAAKEPDLNLVCVGGGEFTETENKLHCELRINEKCRQITLNDSQLASAYKQAYCFVFPSLYEGFGIPVLEAFQNDCVTLLANASSLPEVGGNAAIYFDPNSEQELAECILSAQLRKDDYIRRGRERLKEFSWEKTVRQTLNVYKEVLQG